MDYQRIYTEFIDDRIRNESLTLLLYDYTERHHIIPKSLGGVNHDFNIVKLTPEDHLFSHLLLAKIHGGMAHSIDNRMNSKKQYTFYHHDGDSYTGNVFEFCEYSNEELGKVNGLVAGRCDYLRSGYALNKKDALRSLTHRLESQKTATQSRGDSGNIGGLNNPNADHTIYQLYNLRTKVEFKGFRVDFCKMVNFKSKRITRLFSGGIWHDWVVKEKVGTYQANSYIQRNSIHTLIHPITKDEICGSPGYVAKTLGC